MATLAIIGGTGMDRMEGLTVTRREMVKTPFGAPSCPIIYGELYGRPMVFLARHGSRHSIPAHNINYCANIWALHSVGVERVLAVGAVGGVASECEIGTLVIPDQIIDYTYNRTTTFHDGLSGEVMQIDFSYPYDETLRQAMITGGAKAGVRVVDNGTYGVFSGPRFETVAEVRRMERDGCTILGMTGMPEAALARELGMAYAVCATVCGRAAGKGDSNSAGKPRDKSVADGMQSVQRLMSETLPALIDANA